MKMLTPGPRRGGAPTPTWQVRKDFLQVMRRCQSRSPQVLTHEGVACGVNKIAALSCLNPLVISIASSVQTQVTPRSSLCALPWYHHPLLSPWSTSIPLSDLLCAQTGPGSLIPDSVPLHFLFLLLGILFSPRPALQLSLSRTPSLGHSC